jgi:hypothetical protein
VIVRLLVAPDVLLARGVMRATLVSAAAHVESGLVAVIVAALLLLAVVAQVAAFGQHDRAVVFGAVALVFHFASLKPRQSHRPFDS